MFITLHIPNLLIWKCTYTQNKNLFYTVTNVTKKNSTDKQTNHSWYKQMVRLTNNTHNAHGHLHKNIIYMSIYLCPIICLYQLWHGCLYMSLLRLFYLFCKKTPFVLVCVALVSLTLNQVIFKRIMSLEIRACCAQVMHGERDLLQIVV